MTHNPTGVPTKSWFKCVTRATRPQGSIATVTRPLPRVGPALPQADALTAAVSSCWVAAARSNGRAGGGGGGAGAGGAGTAAGAAAAAAAVLAAAAGGAVVVAAALAAAGAVLVPVVGALVAAGGAVAAGGGTGGVAAAGLTEAPAGLAAAPAPGEAGALAATGLPAAAATGAAGAGAAPAGAPGAVPTFGAGLVGAAAAGAVGLGALETTAFDTTAGAGARGAGERGSARSVAPAGAGAAGATTAGAGAAGTAAGRAGAGWVTACCGLAAAAAFDTAGGGAAGEGAAGEGAAAPVAFDGAAALGALDAAGGTGAARSRCGATVSVVSGEAPTAVRLPGSGAGTFSARLGSCTASVRWAVVLAGASALVVKALTRMVPPSTTAASASHWRLRGRGGVATIAPGGTETELGFCAGVSSLLVARRTPPAGVGTRESRGRPVAELGSASDAGVGADAAASAAARATASAGDSKPIWVVVRVGCSGTGDAFGRDGVLRGRRECGRGAELGLGRAEIPPGVVSTLAGALPVPVPVPVPLPLPLAGLLLAERAPPAWTWPLSGGGVLERAGLLATATLALPADAAGGSDPDRAPTV